MTNNYDDRMPKAADDFTGATLKRLFSNQRENEKFLSSLEFFGGQRGHLCNA